MDPLIGKVFPKFATYFLFSDHFDLDKELKD